MYHSYMTPRKNIFLTGAPSSGKTTVIKRVIQSLGLPAAGFFTEEERRDGRRVGFRMRTLDGNEGYLAHEDIRSECAIRRFGVDIGAIERIAVPSLSPRAGAVIILDEIGKMECFSHLFCEAAKKALDSPCVVVGTITLGGHGFIREVKGRGDIEIIEVTAQNRDSLPAAVVEMVRRFVALTARG